MALAPGTRLGAYEIVVGLVGAGGMGEVYKATDTRLDRLVAIKVLPSDVAADPELKQRFEREAKSPESDDQQKRRRHMKFKALTPIFVILLVPVIALAVALTMGAESVSASGRARRFTGTKDCANFPSGHYCTLDNFSDRRLASLLDGKNLYYEQPAVFPLADGSVLLDSNVAIDAGSGNKARGRCTFDPTNGIGLCTIEDGFGTLRRFHARIDVDCNTAPCNITGTYGFGDSDD